MWHIWTKKPSILIMFEREEFYASYEVLHQSDVVSVTHTHKMQHKDFIQTPPTVYIIIQFY